MKVAAVSLAFTPLAEASTARTLSENWFEEEEATRNARGSPCGSGRMARRECKSLRDPVNREIGQPRHQRYGAGVTHTSIKLESLILAQSERLRRA